MILDENTVALALEVMGDGERAYWVTLNESRAENEVKRIHGEVHLEAAQLGGTVADKEARVEINPRYQAALDRHAIARAERSRFITEANHADRVTSLYQTEKKMELAAERIR